MYTTTTVPSTTSDDRCIPSVGTSRPRTRATRAPRRKGRSENSRLRPGLQAYTDLAKGAPLLTAEEEVRLARALRDHGCTESRDRLICCNLRLVVYMAKRFAGRGSTMPDLIAEGIVGLVRAVDGYDPEVGTRLSTYAVWWISQAMRTAIMRDGPIVHVPAYMFGRMARCRKAARTLERSLGRPPSLDEMRRNMDVSPRFLRAVQHAMDACSPRTPWVSPRDDDGVSLGDRVADQRECGVESITERKESCRSLREAMETLDRRTAEVVTLRFGLDGRESRSLSEIAAVIGTSRERVRQIASGGLRTLHARLSTG